MKPLLLICAWCENAADRTAAAIDAGFDVSHGICEHCAEDWQIEDEATEEIDGTPRLELHPHHERRRES